MASVICKQVNPEILRWARETAGYRRDQVSVSSPHQLEEWEQGKTYPSYSQLEELASYYERPLMLFFSPNIPEEKEDPNNSLYFNQKTHLGRKYIELVLRKYNQQQISLTEAADYLYINPSQFDQLKNEFSSKR